MFLTTDRAGKVSVLVQMAMSCKQVGCRLSGESTYQAPGTFQILDSGWVTGEILSQWQINSVLLKASSIIFVSAPKCRDVVLGLYGVCH